jgi:tetratricopeptide (TPR) repeat protein
MAVQESTAEFRKITRYYAHFHLIFLALGFVEIFCFLLFFSFFAKSAFLGISIGILFFTGFSYFVLLFYFQGKKPEQLLSLRKKYLDHCKQSIVHAPDTVEYHLAIVKHLYEFVDSLENQEYHYYKLPLTFETLSFLLEKLSVWTFWKEVHLMKEILLQDAVQEHLHLIKKQPTHLQIHASLAQAYQKLAFQYVIPKGKHPLPIVKMDEMKQKFQTAMGKALEEFKIISHFSPQNAWVHSELANTYQALKLPLKEIEECETLRALLPESKDVLLRLGTLYFQEGKAAQGLLIYEELKNVDGDDAQNLISRYTDP